MTITILDKRITIESGTYNKTFDFTKVMFVGTSLFFDSEEVPMPTVEGDTQISILATLNETTLYDDNAASSTDAINVLKNHLQQVDLFFLARGNSSEIFTSTLLPYTGAVSATQATVAPSINSSQNSHVYQWQRVGNLVTMFLRLHFEEGGTAVSELVCAIPEEMPVPSISIVDPNSGANPEFEGLNSTAILSVGNCNWGDTNTNVGLGYCYIINSGIKTDAIRINHTPQTGVNHYQCVLQYFTD
jgi:hypothetical protein